MNEKQLANRFILVGIILTIIAIVILSIWKQVPTIQFIIGIILLMLGVNVAITGLYRGYMKSAMYVKED